MIVKRICEVIPGYLQSASAIEVFADNVYIAGDSLSWLYLYKKNFYFLYRLRLDEHLSTDVLPKADKPDWEAMSVLLHRGYDPMLLIIGSGSKSPQRDKAMLVNLYNNEVSVVPHWPKFYQLIRENIASDNELNIEGLAQVKDKLVLLNRGNVNGGNFIAITDTSAPWQLPFELNIIQSAPADINGVKAGFTGAFYVEEEDVLIYTAAAEITDNAYDDGVVAGSAIGFFSNISKRLAEKELTPDEQVPLNKESGFSGKLESLALHRKVGNKYEFYAVTDNDDEPGSLYLLSLQF